MPYFLDSGGSCRLVLVGNMNLHGLASINVELTSTPFFDPAFRTG